MEVTEASGSGEEALRFRERVGLSEVRIDSGEVGADVLDLMMGSSTMYIGVSKSRNSTSKH